MDNGDSPASDQEGSSPAQSVTAPDNDEKSSLRRQSIDATELVSNELGRRFDHPGLRMLVDPGGLLLRWPKDMMEEKIKDNWVITRLA